jgi:hypothetical protein
MQMVNVKKKQALLTVRLGDELAKLSLNMFKKADIVREAGSVNDVFYLTNKKYTQEIGIRAVNWKFSDGASVDKEIDAMIYHKPKNDGQKWVLVTITDNLGNKKTLSSSWW